MKSCGAMKKFAGVLLIRARGVFIRAAGAFHARPFAPLSLLRFLRRRDFFRRLELLNCAFEEWSVY